jgi:hypothetical protein
MQTCECMLVTAGALLSQRQRMDIEAAVARGLMCLSKGLFSIKCDVIDRKVCRGYLRDSLEAGANENSVEILRCSSAAQIQLIRLAIADATAPNSDGTLSGNITLLRNALDLMCAHANPECRLEGRRVATLLSAILHPVSVPLPAAGSDAVVRNFVDRRLSSLQQRASAPISLSSAEAVQTSGDLPEKSLGVDKRFESHEQRVEKVAASRGVESEVSKERSSAGVAPIPAGFKHSTATKVPDADDRAPNQAVSTQNKRSFGEMNNDGDKSDDSELPEIVY